MIIAIFIISTIITTTTSIIILVYFIPVPLTWNHKKSRAGAAQSLFLWFREY